LTAEGPDPVQILPVESQIRHGEEKGHGVRLVVKLPCAPPRAAELAQAMKEELARSRHGQECWTAEQFAGVPT